MLLTDMLSGFQAVLALGMQNAAASTFTLFRILATIEIAALGIWWLYSRDNAMGMLIFRVITIAAFLWLIQDWQNIVGAIQASFMKLGIILGGNTLNLPSVHGAGMALIDKGQELHLAILGKTADPTWLEHIWWETTAVFTRSPAGWAQFVVAWLVLLTFLVAGIHVFAIQLEFAFSSAMAFITIPFAVWNRTAWISERTFGAVIGSGIKLAYLYMLTSASIVILKQYVAPVVLSQKDSMQMLGAGALILFLQWGAHKLASGLIHGMPSFTHNDVVPRVGMSVGLATAGISMAARTMTQAAQTMGQVAQRRRRP